MIKIGLIGAGFMGGTHSACYESLLGNGYFKVTAVADPDFDKADKISVKFGAKVYATGKELIEKGDVNTIDICLPTYLHTEHALSAMEKGYNVFIEKPVCLHEDEAGKLLEMKKKTGTKVAVGHCIRFWPEYAYLKKLVEDETYGKLISGVFKRISPRPMWGWDQWLLQGERSGSAALDLHIHDVDYVRYILGIPVNIKGEISSINGNNEHIFSLYKYEKAVVSIEGGWDYPSCMPFEMEYRVRFDKATVVFNSGRTPSLMLYNEDGTVTQPVLQQEFDSESEGLGGNLSSLGGYYNEIKYFLQCLNNGDEIKIAPLEEGIESLRLTMREIKTAEK
ncbi:MAG: Gfo/Idh/MocA family oxidoreductase [Ruminiclostridium sp.]|nr:Gfo/Idh/MocA family oxidoreductase [Ruminiclostridium sp.]